MGKFYEGLYGDLARSARQVAWLNAIPERPDAKPPPPSSLSRLAELRRREGDEKFHPGLPDAGAEYLLGYLFEIGPTMSGAMGEVPLTHGELAAWQSNVGIKLQPWEARFVIRLSREYLAQSQSSEKRTCKAPWQPEGLEIDRSEVADGLRKSITEMAKL